jgi:hypothetical protein
MKIKFLLLTLVFIICACRKDIKKDIDFAKKYNKPNEVTLKVNGETYPMVIKNLWNYRDEMTLSLSKIFKCMLEAEQSNLSFGKIKLVSGIQTLHRYKPNKYNLAIESSTSFFTMTSDGDVLADTYELVESDSLNNFFNITAQKNNFKEIKGEFSATFVRIELSKHTQFPNLDTVRIRDGKFHLFLN